MKKTNNLLPKILPLLIIMGIGITLYKAHIAIMHTKSIVPEIDTVYVYVPEILKDTVNSIIVRTHTKTIDNTDTLKEKYLQEYALVLERMLKEKDSVIDSLIYNESLVNENYNDDIENYKNMLRLEKENTAILSNALRIPMPVQPITIKKQPIQSIMADISHLGNYPAWPPMEFRINQVRLNLGYSRALGERLWWYGKIGFPLYNGTPKQEYRLWSVHFGYQYKW